MKKALSIGQMAKMFHIDVQTLHLYDQKGLLVPAYRNRENNWRQYTFEQAYQLSSIRFLRKLGYSLARVKIFLQERTFLRSMERLREQSVTLRKQCEELLLMDAVIQKKLNYIEGKYAEFLARNNDQPHVKWFDACCYVPLGDEQNLYRHDVFYYYPTMVLYEHGEKWFGAYIFDDFADAMQVDSDVALSAREIPQGNYLCCYHMGAYATIDLTAEKLRSTPGYILDSLAANTNIIDHFVERDDAHYITEIRIRILDA